jgi:phosphoglycolate phosphatase
MIKNTLIFDFDLTLADATKGIFECMNYSLNHFGYPGLDFETIKKTIGYDLPTSFQMLTGNYNIDTASRFVEIYVAKADQMMNLNTFVYPEVFDLMPEIKNRGYKTAIVSTKFRYRIEDILKRDNLEKYFDFVVGGEDVIRHKPHPDGLNLAVEKLGTNRNQALFIGDSLVDIDASVEAGICFCAVLTGTNNANEFSQKQVKYIIENLNGLFEVLDYINAQP